MCRKRRKTARETGNSESKWGRNEDNEKINEETKKLRNKRELRVRTYGAISAEVQTNRLHERRYGHRRMVYALGWEREGSNSASRRLERRDGHRRKVCGLGWGYERKGGSKKQRNNNKERRKSKVNKGKRERENE